MKVSELLSRLAAADPNAVVLFLGEYVDATDATEIKEIIIPDEGWTCERYAISTGNAEVHHPTAHGLSLGWDEVTCTKWAEAVVILSTGPLNLQSNQ